jgi:hypothetical protein
MLVDSVTDTSTYTYVQGTTYDAAGRLNVRTLGADVLRTDYNYFAWTDANGWGRLQQIKAGTPADLDSLQDLRYTYDAPSNVLTIQDYKAGSPQTQTFTYDALSRLISAVASGGSGGTYASQTYTYSTTTGNLSSKAGVNYYYDLDHDHGVNRKYGSGGSSKTIDIQAKSTVCDDGVGATMELWVNGLKKKTWTNVATSWTTYSWSTTLSGDDVIDVVFTNDCNSGGYDRNLYVDYVVVDGETIQAEGASTIIDKGGGSAAFDGQNVILGQAGIYWNAAFRMVVGAGAFAGGYDANGNPHAALRASMTQPGGGWSSFPVRVR